MSRAIVVYFDCDFPCNDWNETDCPMKEKWHEGEERMCLECGWKILYDEGQNHSQET